MSIWHRINGWLTGGWKTHGPNAIAGPGAFDGTDPDSPFSVPTAETAMRISAVWACTGIRSETIGTMPFHVMDKEKNPLIGHPVDQLFRVSPNYNHTPAEFFSLATAHTDLYGNGVNIIERRANKEPFAVIPVDPCASDFSYNKSGSRKTWKIGDEKYSDDDILHFRGFSLDGEWGMSRLHCGRSIIGSQLEANRSAMLAFKQGLKVGGFFENNRTGDMTEEQLLKFAARLNTFGQMENAHKWMTLPKGLKPLGGDQFRIKPADAQLLESRFFGIEEICRLFNVPPPLIHHSNKASSWASSIENINLHFVIYSLMPTIIRYEQRIAKRLLTPTEIAAGLSPRFSLQGLLRGDMKTRMQFYTSALQNGWLSRDEVRDLEERGKIPGGDKYTVQTNMIAVEDMTDAATDTSNTKPEGDDNGDSKQTSWH